ncbi:acyl-CoA thioesterase-1 [Mucilaginibacter lappiensis]|uniref:Acyl-CoA thioesterase-1 n=1 Tax=Mucilaginibacter lappiensis TaxID=354630 RepID=A0ABR6PK71_9SPHI|nr:SGNH/GDSL hydrolase family protein [Mucilaginibacter lappiensis]MBB6110165.1 acyl-CoA thioesterase-1 [Mucilaginibacter lappiensis]SIR51242.1 acyl-CoA thioesterase-1 [Mucilaginibacter lappiensis]
MKINLLIISLTLLTIVSQAQTQLVKNLQAGKAQTLVVYGTSLTAGAGGHAWVDSVSTNLNNKYNNNLTVYNAAKSAMWSTWGVQHLEDSVISKKPDAVLIEFSMNDAFLNYKTSRELAELNLNYMIDRIKLFNPDCEIILQTMDIALDKHAADRPELTTYYDLYRQVAKKRKLLLIDHYPHWKAILDKGKEEYLKYVPDGLHPDPDGARKIIAPYVVEKLMEGK